jgi:prophage tail gpP-like protein
MSDAPFAAIEVESLFLDAWTEYRFESDIFTPADAFSLTLGIGTSDSKKLRQNLDYLRTLCFPGALVKFWIGHGDKRALQGTGRIDRREITNDGEGTRFTIEGRDLAAHLVDDAAPLSLYRATGTTLFELARDAVLPFPEITITADSAALRDVRTGKAIAKLGRRLEEKAEQYGIPVAKLSDKVLAGIDAGAIDIASINISGFTSTAGAIANGASLSPLQIAALKIQDARPQAGETRWEFLDRHARRLGLLMRMGPDGTLNFMGPDYGQAPLYKLERSIDSATLGTAFAGLRVAPNTILAGGEIYDGAKLYRQVDVFGRVRNGDLARAALSVSVRDDGQDALPYEKTLFVQDDSLKSEEEATKRGYRELAKSRMGAQVLEYTVRGHGQSGRIYAVDTVAQVEDQVCGISGPYYVVSRTFVRDGNGPRTTLRLVPLNSIVIG